MMNSRPWLQSLKIDPTKPLTNLEIAEILIKYCDKRILENNCFERHLTGEMLKPVISSLGSVAREMRTRADTTDTKLADLVLKVNTVSQYFEHLFTSLKSGLHDTFFRIGSDMRQVLDRMFINHKTQNHVSSPSNSSEITPSVYENQSSSSSLSNTCVSSDNTSEREKQLVNHTQCHTDNTYLCATCSQAFPGKTDLNHHAQLCHSDSSTNSQHSVQTTINIANNVSQDLECNKCYKCDKSFQTYENLKIHMATDHTEVYPDKPVYSSTINHYACNEKDTLDDIVLTWSDKCDLCGFNACSESELLEHIRTTHERNAPTCKFCNLTLASNSKLNNHINLKHKEAQPSIISPITQLDGLDLDSFDFDQGTSNTSKRTTNYKLNQTKQTEKIIKDAKKSDYEVTINNNDQNSTIRCSSGFYLQVGRPCFSSLGNGSVLNTSSLVITVDDVTKTSDLNGSETNLIMHFSFMNSLQSCGGVRVHLHHSTRTIQIQGSFLMPNKQRAAAWFVTNVVEKRFKDLAKAKKFAIQSVNNEINKMKNAPHLSSSGSCCQECNISFKTQSRPTLCENCQKLFHKSCHKEHTKSCVPSTLRLQNKNSSSTGFSVSSATPEATSCASSSIQTYTTSLSSSHQVRSTTPTASSTSAPLNSLSSTIVSFVPSTTLSSPIPGPSSSNTSAQPSSPPHAVSNDVPKKNPKRKQKASPPVCQKEATIEFLQNELNAAQTRIVQLDTDIKDKDQQLSVQRARIKFLEDKHNQDILDKYFPHKEKATQPVRTPPSRHCSPCDPPPCSYQRTCPPAPCSCSGMLSCHNRIATIPDDLLKKVESISDEIQDLLSAVNTLNAKVDYLEQSKAFQTNKAPIFSSQTAESHESRETASNTSHDASIVSIEDLISDNLDAAADSTETLPLNSVLPTNLLL